MTLPLTHRRILVTRARHQAGKLSEALRALGAEPVEVPVLEIQPPDSYTALDNALRHLASYDWLILTSANTVRVLSERAATLAIPIEKTAPPHVAVVGFATAAEAHRFGLHVQLTPEEYVAENLIEALKDKIANRRILLARAAIARDVIPDALREAGARIDVVDAYRNGIPAEAPDLLRAALGKPIDAATFTSSSTATHLAETAAKAGLDFPLRGVPAVSIGPVTSQTLGDLGWPPAAEADPHDISGLVAAVVRTLHDSP